MSALSRKETVQERGSGTGNMVAHVFAFYSPRSDAVRARRRDAITGVAAVAEPRRIVNRSAAEARRGSLL